MRRLLSLLLLGNAAFGQAVSANHASSYPTLGSGVGMYGPNYYNSLYFQNLLTVNLGFLSTQQNLQDVVASGTTTTYTSANGFGTETANQLVGYTLIGACHYNGTTGCGGGANLCNSVVTANTAGYAGGSGPVPVTVTFSPACSSAMAANDIIFMAQNVASPNLTNIGWAPFGGNGTFSIDTTTADLPAAFGTLPRPSQVVKLVNPVSGFSYFKGGLDTTSGQLNYAFNGTYNGSISVQVLSGTGCSVTMLAQRGTNAPIINQMDSLAGSGYQTYTFTGSGTETAASPPGGFVTSFTFQGQCTLTFTNPQLLEGTHTNASPARDAVINQIKAMNPGSLRYNILNVGNGGALGCSFDNWIQPPDKRQPCNSNITNGYTATQLAMGFNDFLQMCLAAGVKTCQISLPPTLTQTEFQHMSDFLGGSTATTYGLLRQQLNGGNAATWFSQFAHIILDYGNETWNGNNGDYMGSIFNSAALTSQMCQTLKAMPSWNSTVGQCATNVMQYSGFNNSSRVASVDTGASLSGGPFIDALDSSDYTKVGQYATYFDTNPCTQPGLTVSALNEASANTNNSTIQTNQNLSQAATAGYKIAGYEAGINIGQGSCSSAQIIGTAEGMGWGLVDTLTWAYMQQAFPGTSLTWNYWELNGLNRNFQPANIFYNSGIGFQVGDLVNNGSTTYTVVAPSTGQALTNTTYFVPYTYAGGTTYPQNAMVYDGSSTYYVSNSNGNVGNALTSLTYWTPAATSVAGWGEYPGVGGQYTNARPTVYAQAAANACENMGTGYNVTTASIPVTSPAASNGIPALTNVPQIPVFDYSNGTNECFVIYNLQATTATLAFAGSFAPVNTVTKTVYTSSSLTANNETTANTVANVVSSAAAASSYSLPAYSLTTLNFPLGGGTTYQVIP